MKITQNINHSIKKRCHITIFFRDKNAKHKKHDDEERKMRKYMITCIFQRIKEHQNLCATIWFMVKLNGNKRHRIGKREKKVIHAKNIIIPILINSTHFHTLPHFWNFTNFKNPTSSF